MRKPALEKRSYCYAANWTVKTPEKLFNEYLDKIEFSDQFKLTEEFLGSLKPTLRMAYNNWADGHDLRGTLPKNTFYRHRRALMDHGIDISVSSPNKHAEPIPIKDVIKNKPCPIPPWALNTEIYFAPENLPGNFFKKAG